MTRIEISSQITSQITDAQVGKTVRISGTAYVYEVHEDMIEVGIPGKPETLPGDRTYKLVSNNIELVNAHE